MDLNEVGIVCTVPNQWGRMLHEWLGKELNQTSIWVSQGTEEILYDSSYEEIEIEKRIRTNEEMKQRLGKKPYYPIFATFAIYFKSDEIATEITNVQDFITSSCDVLLSIVDVTEVVLLVKDHAGLQELRTELEPYIDTICYATTDYPFDHDS